MARRRLPPTKRIVGIADIADLLNYAFGLTGYDALDQDIPRTWWHRSRPGRRLAAPMPTPDYAFGREPKMRPAWDLETIVDWYAEWKLFGREPEDAETERLNDARRRADEWAKQPWEGANA